MDRGIDLSIAVLAFVAASAALHTAGVYGALGVGVNTGLEDEVSDVKENPNVVRPEVDEGLGTGFLGAVRHGANLISVLATFPVALATILTNLGVPTAIAAPFGLVASVSVAVTFAKFVRGIG